MGNGIHLIVAKPDFLNYWHQFEPNISFTLHNEWENFPAKEGTQLNDKCDSNVYYRAFHRRVIFPDTTSS